MKTTLSTVVAVVRHEAGMPIENFAKLIGKSLSTAKKLESGILKLSDETALIISKATGVGLAWLLTGDPKAPIVTDRGTPWTKKIFSWHEGQAISQIIYAAALQRGAEDAREFMAVDLGDALRKLLMSASDDVDQFALAFAKAQRFLNDLERDIRK